MHVRVVALVVIAHRLDDHTRLLARRGVVEVDQRMPVHLLIENGEVSAERFPIDHPSLFLHLNCSFGSHRCLRTKLQSRHRRPRLLFLSVLNHFYTSTLMSFPSTTTL